MKQNNKPEKYTKSWIQFVSDHRLYSLAHDELCPQCGGSGSLYDPDDPPDVIEGNKFRNVLKCQVCSGKGHGDFLHIWRAKYISEKNEANEKYKKQLQHKRERNRILKKLTPSERKFLGLV